MQMFKSDACDVVYFGGFRCFSLFCRLVEIGRSLVELNLSFNRIVQIEPFVGRLEKLVVLDVGYEIIVLRLVD